jgi:hypothetical protein
VKGKDPEIRFPIFDSSKRGSDKHARVFKAFERFLGIGMEEAYVATMGMG